MDVNEINNKIGQAKNNLNAMKGQSDGLLSEAQIGFVGSIVQIIDGLIADNVALQGKITELVKVPKEESKKK